MTALLINPVSLFSSSNGKSERMQGHSHQEVTEIVQQVWEAHKGEGEGRVEIAAYNSVRRELFLTIAVSMSFDEQSSQIVLSGSQAGVDRAADELYARDIARKATDLPVWVPFHSSL
jgi:malonyl CoA-acyl carrier protein transacylase